MYFLGEFYHNEDKHTGIIASVAGEHTIHFKFGKTGFKVKVTVGIGSEIVIPSSVILNEYAQTELSIENPNGVLISVNGYTCLYLIVIFNATGTIDPCQSPCDNSDNYRAGEFTNIQENVNTFIPFSSTLSTTNYILQLTVWNGFGFVGHEIISQQTTGFTIKTMAGAGVSQLKYFAIKTN